MTSRQQEICHFIETFWEAHWTSPTVGQIADALGLKSKASVHRHLMKMVEEGILERRVTGGRVIYRVVYEGDD